MAGAAGERRRVIEEHELKRWSVVRRVGVVVAFLTGVSVAVGVPATPASAAPAVNPALGISAAPVQTFTDPTAIIVAVAFAPDGKLYAADKTGRVLRYDRLGDPSATVVVDLRTAVHDSRDRGLLGMTLDPSFATNPYLYVMYAYDKDPFGPGTVPAWGTANGSDGCGPGQVAGTATAGCAVTARISRFRIDATGAASPEQVLVDSTSSSGWCEQFESHSVGTLAFGPSDGMLYASAGEGASFGQSDWGQQPGTNPSGVLNPCNDPPGGRGRTMEAPSAEGGSLRAQSARSTVADGYSPLDGAILRIDPATGAAPTDNPLVGNGVPGDDRIVAFGLRNPFRFGFRPGTSQIWLGDVGNASFEEIDRFNVSSTSVPNFGWPCYEGDNSDNSGFNGFNLCVSYDSDIANGRTELVGSKQIAVPTQPLISMPHQFRSGTLMPGQDDGRCPREQGAAALGGGFIGTGTTAPWPAGMRGAYVFGDYAQGCLWYLPAGSLDSASPASAAVLLASNIHAAQVITGPDGGIYAIDIYTGTLWRFGTGPVAAVTASTTNAVPHTTVHFSAAASTGAVSYSWALGESAIPGGVTADVTFDVAGVYVVSVTVRDGSGTASTASVTVQIGSVPVITSVTSSAQGGWAVSDAITYAATATGEGPLSYTWTAIIKHCSATTSGDQCHEHFNPVGSFPDAPSGSFVAPTHEWRPIIQLRLTVTDQRGLSASASLDLPARGQPLTVVTEPPGLSVGYADRVDEAPFTSTVTEGDPVQISLPTRQVLNGSLYVFAGWSDAPNARANRVLTLTSPQTIHAVFTPVGGFTPVRPVRLLDTRDGTGGAGGKLADGGIVRLQITGSNGAPAAATAVVVNITATESIGPGFVTAYPCDGERPLASNVNYAIGETVANLTQVRLAADGSVCLFSQRAVHLVVDLSGYFSTSGNQYQPVDPLRVLDTRSGIGAPAGKVGPSGEIKLDLSTFAPFGATAAVLNLTGTDNQWGAGYVSAYPCAGERPFVSNLNSRLFDTRPNLVVVPLGPGATVCLYAQPQLHLVADLAGWYVPEGSLVSTQNPLRVLDTRENFGADGPVAGNTTITLNLDGYAPIGATAVVMNITSVDQVADGYITVWPCGERPVASNLNVLKRDTRPNLVMVRLSAARTVCVYTQQTGQIIGDLAGWALA